MKIAVLSDIHGNYQALEAVMKDIKAQNCEKVLCLGDIAMAGPEPSLVIDFVQKQTNWTVIQGNTDSYVATHDFSVSDNIKKNNLIMGNACESDMKVLSDDCFEFLKNLPVMSVSLPPVSYKQPESAYFTEFSRASSILPQAPFPEPPHST